jgi:NitT/TauT family transport system substrate-binding protein
MKNRFPTSWRLLIGVAALGLLLAACGDADGDDPDGGEPAGDEVDDQAADDDAAAAENGELELTEITVGTLPISDLMQFYVADSQGFFEDEGLTVEQQNMSSGAAVAAGIESGALDVGWSNSVSIFQAHAQGLEFQYIAGGLFQGPDHWTQAITVAAGSDIAEPGDLEGRSVALNGLGNINELVMRAYLDDQGMDPDGVNFVEMPFPDMASALESGQVDAALPTEPFVTGPTNAGAVEILEPEPFSVLGSEPFVAGWFARTAWAEDNPNTADAFFRAVQTATEYLEDNPEIRLEMIAEYTQIDPELAEQIGFGINVAELTPEDLQEQVDMSEQYGLISSAFDADEILAPTAAGGQ